jgi:hypothetical protein
MCVRVRTSACMYVHAGRGVSQAKDFVGGMEVWVGCVVSARVGQEDGCVCRVGQGVCVGCGEHRGARVGVQVRRAWDDGVPALRRGRP